MTYEKIDSDTLELTHKQTVFKADLLSEKETIEARLFALNEMLNCLNK